MTREEGQAMHREIKRYTVLVTQYALMHAREQITLMLLDLELEGIREKLVEHEVL